MAGQSERGAAQRPRDWAESLERAVAWRFRARRAQIIINACASLAGLAAALVGVVVCMVFDSLGRLGAAMGHHPVGTALYFPMRAMFLKADLALVAVSLLMLFVALRPSRVVAAATALAAAFQGCAWVAYEVSSWHVSFNPVPLFFTVVAFALATALLFVRPSGGRGRGA